MKVNEIFGFGKKAQMRRGAIKIAKDVVIEQIIKPALIRFRILDGDVNKKFK